MNEPENKRKTFAVPDASDVPADRQLAFSFGGLDRVASGVPYQPELRDTSKPIAYDEHGRPLYAPRGIIRRSS
jgi:hypothetical protein